MSNHGRVEALGCSSWLGRWMSSAGPGVGLALALLLAASSVAAASDATVVGTSGLFSLPTADFLPDCRARAALHYFDDAPVMSLGAGLGAGAELYISAVLKPKWANNVLGFKAHVLDETDDMPSLAVGIEGVDELGAYIVASKTLSGWWRMHAGIGGGTREGLFIGFSKLLNPLRVAPPGGRWIGSRTEAKMELAGSDLTLGLSLQIDERLRVGISVSNMERANFAVSYDFSLACR